MSDEPGPKIHLTLGNSKIQTNFPPRDVIKLMALILKSRGHEPAIQPVDAGT